MKRFLLPLACCCLVATGCSTHRFVASKYPTGRPEVVLFLKGKGEDAVKVMEKVYHPNGKLDYVGRFEDGKEQGEWNYYYEDGTRKYTEHWDKGLEEGVQIEYAPDEWCVESKALKLYLGSFRNQGEFHESCVNRICNDLVALLNPLFIRVVGKFTPRGGIAFWPTAEWAQGCDGVRVTHASELVPALKSALQAAVPTLVEVVVS